MNRAELLDKLQRVDENIFLAKVVKPNVRVDVVIVGASALLLSELSKRGATKDVDILRAEQGIKQIMFEDPDFNDQCSAYVQCLPYNFEDRLVKIEIETYAIDIYVPSVEDLAVMKLYRWEQPDIDDLTAPEFLAKLDWAQLEHLIQDPSEAAASRSADPEQDRELRNLLFNYEEYKRGWRK